MIPDHPHGPAAESTGPQTGQTNGRAPVTVPGSPGEVLLKLFMAPLGLTAYRVSTDLSVPPIAISEILRGRRAISPAMAARLGVYFGVEPHFWLALQSAYDLRLAFQGPDGDDQQFKGVTRCGALVDRQFVIRESKNGADRNYEVILARVRVATTTRMAATATAAPTKKQAAAGKTGEKGRK